MHSANSCGSYTPVTRTITSASTCTVSRVHAVKDWTVTKHTSGLHQDLLHETKIDKAKWHMQEQNSWSLKEASAHFTDKPQGSLLLSHSFVAEQLTWCTCHPSLCELVLLSCSRLYH